MKVIKIKLNPNEYFIDVLQILQAIPPFNNLVNRDIQVYARLLFYDYEMVKENVEVDERNKVLFGYKMRRQIQEDIDISDGSYRNCLYKLKSLGIIGNRKLINHFTIPFGEGLEFKFFNNNSNEDRGKKS